MIKQPNLFTRPDTIFGACQGLADDLGLNPLWVRVPLAASILVSPVAACAAYAVLCVLVLLSRLSFPSGQVTPAVEPAKAAVPVPPTAPRPAAAHANEERELAEAA